jgi:hypothetical protein
VKRSGGHFLDLVKRTYRVPLTHVYEDDETERKSAGQNGVGQIGATKA